MYRMKHVPTGLYFQPCKHKGSHLSKRGKIYQTNNNGIEKKKGYETFRITCQKGSKIHKDTASILDWKEKSRSSWSLYATTNFEDWVREQI